VRLQQENSFISLRSFKPLRQIPALICFFQPQLHRPMSTAQAFSPPTETWRKLRPASPFNRPLKSWDSASSVNRDRMRKRQHFQMGSIRPMHPRGLGFGDTIPTRYLGTWPSTAKAPEKETLAETRPSIPAQRYIWCQSSIPSVPCLDERSADLQTLLQSR
jgi:hypothetical protein